MFLRSVLAHSITIKYFVDLLIFILALRSSPLLEILHNLLGQLGISALRKQHILKMPANLRENRRVIHLQSFVPIHSTC